MTDLTIIVAIDRDRGIGLDNGLPWHLPEDLAHFKRETSGCAVIMGRRTFESIGRPLPNRRCIVVTRSAEWHHHGVETAGSLEAAIALAAGMATYIIGGAQIFDAAKGLATRMIITHIHETFKCDTFFPPLSPNAWTESGRESFQAASGLHYDIAMYDRRTA